MKSVLNGLILFAYIQYVLIAVVSSTPLEASLGDATSQVDNSDHHIAKSKFTYFLKCVHEQCSLIESKPHSQDVMVNNERSNIEEQNSGEEISKRSSNGYYLNTIMKRFFGVNGDPVKMYKPDEITCWTDDCKVQMAKITKRNRNGLGTLACVGDPYTNSGSRCVPIEGLYIGKK